MQLPLWPLLAPLLVTPALLFAQTPEAPKVMDDRLTVELVAMEPDVRTPTAIASDDHGRVWVLENNTHFRPKNYDGPPTDRILLMEDFGPDGRARKITPWADGFRDGMGMLVLSGAESGVIVSTRSETIRLSDTDGDGKADKRTTLLKLETKSSYPHNGLSGITRGPDGKIYLGLGENFGAPWVLRGTDGVELHGSDEGAIFRINPDGTELEWWALGVWNPFGLAFAKENQLFALDNDPSGGSLCRLLHIVRGGDYGYRFRYGRTVDHPFISWFGQIPGTLPPVCLVGEAPCGMIGYSRSPKGGLPAEYIGSLIGTTWTDRGLQRFQLNSEGLSFTSKAEWLVRGDEFRPSGVTQAPDGSLLVSDWVQGSYELHGKGRVWRVKANRPEQHSEMPQTDKSSLAEELETGFRKSITEHENRGETITPDEELLALWLPSIARGNTDANSRDQFATHRLLMGLVPPNSKAWLEQNVNAHNEGVRLGVLLAMRRSRSQEYHKYLPEWLKDSNGAVRRAALQWISEEGLKEFQPKLDVVLEGQPTRATFQAYLATVQMLTSGKPDSKATVEETARVAFDSNRAPELRALALRLLPTNYAKLTIEKLKALLDEQSDAIRTEAVRILASRTDDSAQAELRRIATDEKASDSLRAEAIAGLALSAQQPATREILKESESSPNPEIARLAKRALGTPLPDLGVKQDQALLAKDGDPAAGRRIFFHPNGPRCFTCHTVEGRGVAVGPDLTNLGRFTPEELLTAIREPSKDIGPTYAQWHVRMRDGKEGFGIDLFEDNKSEITLIDATARKTKYKVSDIVSRDAVPVSLMPPALDAALTPDEVRDLIAFLREKRE